MLETERKVLSLVPVRQLAETEKPILTKENERIISTLVIPYLKKNRLKFTNENLQGGLEVLAFDALPRGMYIMGKRKIESESELRSFVKRGIEERESVFTLSQRALGSVDINRDGENLGPYALERKALQKVRNKTPEFSTEADITDFEKLAYQYIAAKRLLPRITEAVLNTLPKEIFTQASLDRFPTADEQSKLVRNALVSSLFIDNVSPLISIELLERLVIERGLVGNLTEDSADKIIDILPQELKEAPETREYLKNLFFQLKEALPRLNRIYQGKSEAEITQRRDEIFKKLNHVLLLLHPALEEEQIITDPKGYKEGLRSLWDETLGMRMDKVILPTPDGLRRAMRVAQARGVNPKRFSDALNAWRLYESGIERKRKEILRLGEEISRADMEIKSFPHRKGSLPSTAFELARIDNYREYDELSRLRQGVSVQETRLKEILNDAKMADSYYEQVLKENNGVIPRRIRKPQTMIDTSINQSKGQLQARIQLALRIMSDNFQARIRGTIDFSDDASSQQLASRMKIVDKEIEETMKGKKLPVNLRFSAVAANIKKQLLDHEFRRRKGFLITGDKERLRELRVLDSLNDTYNNATGENVAALENIILRRFHAYELRNEFKSLEIAREARKRIETAERNPRFNYWSKEKMLAWIKISHVSIVSPDMPDKEKYKKELELWNDIYNRIDARHKTGVLPDVIPDVDGVRSFIQKKIQEAEKRSNETPPTGGYERYLYFRLKNNLADQLECVKALEEVLDNPIFAFKECEGMKRDDFMRVLEIRRRMVFALITLEKDKPELINKEKSFRKTARTSYFNELKKRKSRLVRLLGETEQSSPEDKLTASLNELDLVLRLT